MPQVTPIPIDAIHPGDNDRTVFEPGALRELALSILEHGLLQPVTLRPLPEGGYQLVAGERRWRAHQLARELLATWGQEAEVSRRADGAYIFELAEGEATRRYTSLVETLETIPAIVREDLDDEAAAALMLAENVARADLDPIDEARAYRARMERYGWEAGECAQRAGVSAGRVHNRLKLLELRQDLQALVRSGQLGLGYAQTLAGAGLDSNRQLIAVQALREKDSPNPTWFRNVVNALVTEQAQEAMWDLNLFLRQPPVDAGAALAALDQDPPHPDTTLPPRHGTGPVEVIAGQIKFWEEAGHAWGQRGQSHKRHECEAAATALSALLATL